MHIGELTMRGDLQNTVIRGPRPGLRQYFLDRVTKRASETERLLDGFATLFGKLQRADQFAAEIRTLEDRLGLPTMLPDVRREDTGRVLPAYFKILASRALAKISGVMVMDSQLSLTLIRGGQPFPLGIASMRVITTTGVNFLTDAFQNLTEIELLNFHGIGTGVAAEAVGDTTLGTELTTEYNPNSTRATGTQSEPSANVYRTVGTNTLDSGTPAITEHGILSQAATGGGTLWDRSVFSAINLVGANGDGLASTYSMTSTSGG
jgi:hypothetical protein